MARIVLWKRLVQCGVGCRGPREIRGKGSFRQSTRFGLPGCPASPQTLTLTSRRVLLRWPDWPARRRLNDLASGCPRLRPPRGPDLVRVEVVGVVVEQALRSGFEDAVPEAFADQASESYPDLFQPYGGFPDSVRVEGGHIVMPDLPGIGFEGKSDLIKVMRELAE